MTASSDLVARMQDRDREEYGDRALFDEAVGVTHACGLRNAPKELQ